MQVLLRELGVEQLLTPDAIPLDHIFVEDDQSAHFGNAVHRARVKVTQEDVEAAAVTVISGQEPSSNDIITDMHIKYPFLWFIYDKMYADILYFGVFNEFDKHVSQTKLTDSVISDAMFKFAVTSLHKYASIKPKENFVFSPYKIYHGLYSAYMISSGEMEQRLRDILYLPNVSKFELLKIINFDKYPANRPARYKDATSYMPYHYVIQNQCIFLNKKLCKDFKTMRRLYNAGFGFKSNNNIQDTNRELNESLQLLLKSFFRKLVNLKVKTEVSSDELQVDVKELIIKEHYTSLYMLIPSSTSTNNTVKTDMSTGLSSLIERLDKPLSIVIPPTFEIEKYLDMRALLRELGVEQLLTPDAIPLDHIFVEDDQSVHFGNAVHRARVKVTQEDVKAAAVTVISGQEPCSNDIIIDVNINYPFLWLIYDKMNADILYIGVFNKVDKPVS
ncbi:serine protease inhibitor 88Ea-like [Nylanderia fulva]|uniref:serine protease inhibitor 88Ea-like n=1 Tax=Nylanderia fulva TaxID=613905 RepID=UPI0010FB4920|nr:serine protease inhibitor 88Ea-like [Nylanderia fulva]